MGSTIVAETWLALSALLPLIFLPLHVEIFRLPHLVQLPRIVLGGRVPVAEALLGALRRRHCQCAQVGFDRKVVTHRVPLDNTAHAANRLRIRAASDDGEAHLVATDG